MTVVSTSEQHVGLLIAGGIGEVEDEFLYNNNGVFILR
jgi:hypothetical protein